jgi:predicted CXXCH cytochrome family protein
MVSPRIGKLIALALLASGCSKPPPPAVITPELRARSTVPDPGAQACAKCHAKEVEAWLASQHANANRLVDPAKDGAARPPGRDVRPEAVIGVTPLIQYLAPFPGGRLQVVDIARDTRPVAFRSPAVDRIATPSETSEWFFAFNEERLPHEWGYWTNRSMNWNSQCAFCHITGFEKRYDPARDAYDSTWAAMGVSCGQCHVNVRPVTGDQCPVTSETSMVTSDTGHRLPVTGHLGTSTNASIQNCATCHARREELTGAFKPGEPFNDHFRLMLADTALFHPDGQVNDEDFEYGSFMMSRMAHKGVTCLNCHDPHSGTLKGDADSNALCLQCHLAPGFNGATPIDFVTHSGHSLTNRGSVCVECHMPKNTYMVRDRRRDHGFTSPDPVLTKELGIPNACTPCHQDKNVEWEIEAVEKWYGTNMNRRARDRARVIADARAGRTAVVSNLLAMTATEEIDAWRATLVELLGSWSYRADVRSTLTRSLRDTNALVRAAAIHGLQGSEGAYELLAPLRKDPSRLVRIDAARATLNPVENEPVSYAELKAYLAATCDQPAGALRMAQFHLAEGRMADAETWARKAVAWDPTSGATHSFLGQLLNNAGKTAEAEASLRQACAVETNSASHPYTLALFLAEAGRTKEAEMLLEQAVALDTEFGRAWYNLGLAYAQAERLDDAIMALQNAERTQPDLPDAAYAAATIHLRRKDPGSAKAACLRALAILPEHAPSLSMLRRL